MTNDTCPWHIFDDHDGENIDAHFQVIEYITTVVTLPLFILLFFYPNLWDNWSYKGITYFMASAWFRRCFKMFVACLIDINDKQREDPFLCGVFGFLETFMAIHEVECLTHLCIERYVVAKYTKNDWPLNRNTYAKLVFLSIIFAGVYSLAALGNGHGLDFTCKTCTMDMVLKGRIKYLAIAIFLLRSIKPVGFMIVMLIWAKQVERILEDSARTRMQKQITQDVIWLTAVNLVSWTPIALIRGAVVVSQFYYGPGIFLLPGPFYVKMALIWHWSSLINSVIILFIKSQNIQEAAVNIRFRHLTRDPVELRKTRRE